MKMSDLPRVAPDALQIRSSDGFSKFQSWIHYDPAQVAEFVDLTTESGHKLSLTENHLIYAVDCDGGSPRSPVMAGQLEVGKCVLVQGADGELMTTPVVSIEKTTKTGIYSPLTASGSIVVDGVLASCYSSVESEGLQKFMFSYISAIKDLLPMGGSNDMSTPHLVYAFLDVAKHWVA